MDKEAKRIQSNMSDLKRKKQIARAVVETRWRNKMRLITYKGGKCEKCGYDKPITNAYHFHHKNPDEKEFTVSRYMSRSLDRLKKEVDKCSLLCANCHAEEHDEEYQLSREKTIKSWQEWDIEEEARRKQKLPEQTTCKECNHDFRPNYKTQTYCSPECRINARKVKDKPSKEEFAELLSNNSKASIARMFNVSHTTVQKWSKSIL